MDADYELFINETLTYMNKNEDELKNGCVLNNDEIKQKAVLTLSKLSSLSKRDQDMARFNFDSDLDKNYINPYNSCLETLWSKSIDVISKDLLTLRNQK